MFCRFFQSTKTLMMIRFFVCCALSIGLFVPAAVPAAHAVSPTTALSCGKGVQASEKEENIRESVEKRYGQIADLAAKFVQESYFMGVDEYRTSKGLVSFRRPGKMDWNYEPPDEQRFTSDGSTVWWYQPLQNQVVVRDLTQSFTTDVPVSFLLGVGSLRESFKFKSKCTNEYGIVLTLLPVKENASLDKFYLLVDKKDYTALGARIVDVGGNETAILFMDGVLNKGVEDAHFKFDVPKGTDVIDERKQAAKKEPQ